MLQTLARHYHHLQNEHKRRWRRERSATTRIEEQLLDVRERFDRLLEEWVPDSELQQAWRVSTLQTVSPRRLGQQRFVRWSSAAGQQAAAGSSRSRKGRRRSSRFEIDGSVVTRIAGEKDFTPVIPSFRWRFHAVEFEELFDVERGLYVLADLLARSSPRRGRSAELLRTG